jgi:hypothetical protein
MTRRKPRKPHKRAKALIVPAVQHVFTKMRREHNTRSLNWFNEYTAGGTSFENARMHASYYNDTETLALAHQIARDFIGRELRQLYEVTEELPETLLALVGQLDDVEQSSRSISANPPRRYVRSAT